MPEPKWKTFLDKHRDEVTHMAQRRFEDGTGIVYIQLNNQTEFNPKTKKWESKYRKFYIGNGMNLR